MMSKSFSLHDHSPRWTIAAFGQPGRKLTAVRLIFFTIFIVLTLWSSSATAREAKQVLLLHSYHTGYKWTDDITKAAMEKLNSANGINLRVEYLDTKRIYTPEYMALQKEFILDKYRNVDIDVILCSDNNALTFLLDYRAELFPDTPIVFCGINNFVPSMLRSEKNITGVNETIDNITTINLIRKLHPKMERLIVLTDETTTGQILLEVIEEYARDQQDITWIFPPPDRQEVTTLLNSLGKGDVVLLNLYLRDRNGHLEYDESTRLLTSHSPVPVYSSADFTLGYGVAGGFMTSGYIQGERATQMVMSILSGTPADNIPVLMESPNAYQADHNVTSKFNLDDSAFPPETILINRPPDFYEDHKIEIWIALISLIVLSLLSMFLSVNILRKNKAEAGLLALTQHLEQRVASRTQELQAANENIKEREEMMNHLLSNLSGMVYRCQYDEHWTMLFVSEAARTITGYEPDQLKGNAVVSYASLIFENDHQHIDSLLKKAVDERRPFILEYRIVNKSGEIRWVWEQGLAVYDDDGKVLYLDGIISDITSRKKSELEQKKLATAVHQADELVVITNTTGEIEYVNPAFERVTGYATEEAIGNNPRILKSGKQPPETYNQMWEELVHGRVWRGQFVNKRKDGNEYIAEVTITPIRNQEQEITHYVGIQRDITSQIRMEENLRQAQKLEALGTLAGGIAHEINTPTQFVSNNLSFVIESIADINTFMDKLMAAADTGQHIDKTTIDGLSEEADMDYLLEEIPLALKQSLEGAEQIASIVRSMKQFAHPGEEDKVLANINEAIDNTVTVCRNEWKFVADLQLELDETLPQIPCHRSELNQVFLNIIVNAAHAVGEKYENDNSQGKITITTQLNGDQVEIAIADNGGGIPEELQARIFDPFFTTKEPGKGTGQGLAIAHSIVTEKHDGQLAFTSSPDGTSFVISLPTVEPEAEKAV